MNVFVRPHHTRTSTYMSVFARQTQKCNRHQIVYVCVCVLRRLENVWILEIVPDLGEWSQYTLECDRITIVNEQQNFTVTPHTWISFLNIRIDREEISHSFEWNAISITNATAALLANRVVRNKSIRFPMNCVISANVMCIEWTRLTYIRQSTCPNASSTRVSERNSVHENSDWLLCNVIRHLQRLWLPAQGPTSSIQNK